MSSSVFHKKVILKRAFLSLLSILTVSLSFADTLKERRVYYLDCSYSMVTPNKIWKEVCDNLMNAIDNVEDETTELIVIPFAVDGSHHSILSAYCEKATPNGKTELKKHIRAISPSTHSMTYHSDPLKDFYNNNRVASDRITYMFLMTDGENEEKPDLFQPELKKWQYKYGAKNVYGFYVMLDKSARNKSVSSIIKETEHLWEVETADININLVRFEDNCIFNVRNDKYVDIPIAGKISNISFDLSTSNPLYSISSQELHNDFIRLYIGHHEDEATLPQKESMVINIRANEHGPFDFLVTDKIKVQCCNKKIKGIRPTFNKGKKIEKLGKVTYHPKFWWSKEETKSLTDTLHLHFNRDAKLNNGYAEFEIVDNDGKSIPQNDLHIYIDGKEIVSHKFKVQRDDEDVILTFQYDPSAKSGKHQGWLKLINHNLDQDGDTELSPSQQNNSLHWQIHYEKNMNPLAKTLMWIGILILICLCIWFLIIKPIKYPRFGGIARNISINGNSRRVVFKGYRQVILCNNKHKQSLLNKLFCGKILYIENNILTDDITFVPQMRFGRNVGAVIMISGKNISHYKITPNPMPKVGKVQIVNTKNNITINL